MNYFVVVKTKDDHLHIRLKPSVKNDLKIVADERGMTMSGLVYSLIVKVIREEKSEYPGLFHELVPGIPAKPIKVSKKTQRVGITKEKAK